METPSTTPARGGLARKMKAAMEEIGRVAKRGRNEAQGYDYVRADDVAEAARAALSKHGLAVFADVVAHTTREATTIFDPNKPPKVQRFSQVMIAWTFEDVDTGETRTVKVPAEGFDTGDKGIFKAMTASMKYALMLNFLIPTGEGDPEAETAHDREEKREEAPPPPQRQRPARGNAGARAALPEGEEDEAAKAAKRKTDVAHRLQRLRVEDRAGWVTKLIGRDVRAAGFAMTPDEWVKCDAALKELEAAAKAAGDHLGGNVQGTKTNGATKPQAEA